MVQGDRPRAIVSAGATAPRHRPAPARSRAARHGPALGRGALGVRRRGEPPSHGGTAVLARPRPSGLGVRSCGRRFAHPRLGPRSPARMVPGVSRARTALRRAIRCPWAGDPPPQSMAITGAIHIVIALARPAGTIARSRPRVRHGGGSAGARLVFRHRSRRIRSELRQGHQFDALIPTRNEGDSSRVVWRSDATRAFPRISSGARSRLPTRDELHSTQVGITWRSKPLRREAADAGPVLAPRDRSLTPRRPPARPPRRPDQRSARCRRAPVAGS